jgi:phosphoribosyl 1,2-cyclic phosphodiesterase
MTVTRWGTRGSLPAPGPETVRYGGNTPCVQVEGADGTVLVLDAGTGIRRLGARLGGSHARVDVLLTHLHLDHIQGLGFFAPLRDPTVAVHLWGPASATYSLAARLTRYLSPPLFPIRLRDLPRVQVHEVTGGSFQLGPFTVTAAYVCHPNLTLGYRVATGGPGGAALAYLPDHEPALGLRGAFRDGAWTSGYALAVGADLLLHDAQFTDGEYAARVGWGHSSMRQAVTFAALARARRLVPFHHDPAHTDDELDRLLAAAAACAPCEVTPGAEGATFRLGGT